MLVRGSFTVVAAQVAYLSSSNKHCTAFTKCVTTFEGATIYDAEDLNLVMPMYDLVENRSDYPGTTGILWFYSKDEANLMLTSNLSSIKLMH